MGLGILKKRRWFRVGACLASLFLITCYIETLIRSHIAFFEPPPPTFNYFLEAEEYSKLGFIVNTPTCKILNVSVWDKAILPFVGDSSGSSSSAKDLRCNLNRQWTYVDEEQRLILNKTAVESDGYSIDSLYCCYKPILRGTQSLDNFDFDADQIVIFSKECKPLKGNVTRLENEFIRVLCYSKYWPLFQDIVYRYFHAVPLIPPGEKSINLIKSSSDKPNVLLLGIDSLSRLSFHRNMPETREVLESLGAIEMLGYTKLGENTFPNAVAFTTGQRGFKEACGNESTAFPLDNCSFIWKDFSRSGWLTSLIEDVPYLATFNYLKVGFVLPPVDFYFRPFMLGLYKVLQRKSYYMMECIGKNTVDETLQHYAEDVFLMTSKLNKSAFVYSWSTNLAHLDPTGPRGAPDKSYAQFLSRTLLEKNGNSKNTILFFMSDHGYRYGSIRQTFPGWYEDKLPTFWVYLPPAVKERFPEWTRALKKNKERLSSPMDLYWSMKHIIDAFSENDSTFKNPANSASVQLGQSLFKEIPLERKCIDAGITDNFCACFVPKRLELNDSRLEKSAMEAVNWINERLKEADGSCVPLRLENVVAGGSLEKAGEGMTLIVAFETSPGGFLFEASVSMLESKNNVTNANNIEVDLSVYKMIGEVLRMNKINTDVSCVRNDFLEKLCYCKDTNK